MSKPIPAKIKDAILKFPATRTGADQFVIGNPRDPIAVVDIFENPDGSLVGEIEMHISHVPSDLIDEDGSVEPITVDGVNENILKANASIRVARLVGERAAEEREFYEALQAEGLMDFNEQERAEQARRDEEDVIGYDY